MKRSSMFFAVALVALFALQGFAVENAFMGFDVSTQKMYTVVTGPGTIYAEVRYTQSNPNGYIGQQEVFVPEVGEMWVEGELSPMFPDGRTDLPIGTENYITAYIDILDAPEGNVIQQLVRHDTLVTNLSGLEPIYTYRNGACVPVLPDSIRINSAFCAYICHGSFTIPVVCEDPGYNPDLLEITVSNGCNPLETHCNNSECARVSASEFSWFKRVIPPCRLYLTMTYCLAEPGCVCIWRSDFFLPVEMVPGSFRAVAGDGQVSIGWATASETSTENFAITRSTSADGVFMTVASVEAAGNSTSRRNYNWTDTDVENGTTYYYKLHMVDAAGNHVYNEAGQSVIVSATPGAEAIPAEYALGNYPNPFNSNTTFSFSIPEAGHVTLKIHDLLGREVATVVDGEMAANSYNINWSADGLSAGVYMYTLTSGSFSQTRKLLFIK